MIVFAVEFTEKAPEKDALSSPRLFENFDGPLAGKTGWSQRANCKGWPTASLPLRLDAGAGI
jgi:hypothetical protein